MPVDVKYVAHAEATGGRDGHAKSDDGKVDVELSLPREMGGTGEAGTNPEQLFAAGYAACFLSAMKFVASQSGGTVHIPHDAKVSAAVGIGPRAEGGFGIDVQLDVSLPRLPRAKAEALVQQAHQVCPYSNATRDNVPVRLNVV